MKTCSRCGLDRPVEHYRIDKRSGKHRGDCRTCEKEAKKATVERKRVEREARYRVSVKRLFSLVLDELSLKFCAGCDKVKSREEFHRNAWANDGRHHRCRECFLPVVRKTTANHRRMNPEYAWKHSYIARCKRLGLVPVVEHFTKYDMLEYWRPHDVSWLCIYCDSPAEEVEHMIPIALGGEHTLRNTAMACHACNSIAGTSVRQMRKREVA